MGSLSKRLIRASDNQFQVQVIKQGWARPRLDEAQLLKIRPRQIALIRETILLCAGEPWVYARSIIPLSTLHGRLRHLRKLRNESLGALLFNDPYLARSPFQVSLIRANKLPKILNLQDEPIIWGRRSNFYLNDAPLLVSEMFLPAFNPQQ